MVLIPFPHSCHWVAAPFWKVPHWVNSSGTLNSQGAAAPVDQALLHFPRLCLHVQFLRRPARSNSSSPDAQTPKSDCKSRGPGAEGGAEGRHCRCPCMVTIHPACLGHLPLLELTVGTPAAPATAGAVGRAAGWQNHAAASSLSGPWVCIACVYVWGRNSLTVNRSDPKPPSD